MKKALLSSVALLGLATSTLAADLPSRVAPAAVPASVPVFTWAGLYVGVQAGYAWGDASGTITMPATTVPFSHDGDFDGFVGGAHAGYNLQLGSFVVGVEVDIEATGIEGEFGRVSPTTGSSTLADTNISVQGALRARLGFAFDRALIYATGGLTFANSESDFAGFDAATGSRTAGSYDSVDWGWTLGAGAE